MSSTTSTGAPYPVQHWVPPLHGTWKINCDTATDLFRERGAVAVLIRDATGKLVDGIATSLMTIALVRKACAVRLACSMARALHGATLEVESDCKTLIQLCVSEGVPPWEICAVMNDI
ncbi:hypothetical protein LOK49_LG14G00511 [Camellia lanceoleosa]|uniref:Uncharacterized protein n=1 Tax=Camellia lanceoleosa TaxID=1840588 RepID=A0ACC0FCT1_9ERIC|nr:hypothetical protein LOK49_LG14G00511 [Camellia lanceoleosa]